MILRACPPRSFGPRGPSAPLRRRGARVGAGRSAGPPASRAASLGAGLVAGAIACLVTGSLAGCAGQVSDDAGGGGVGFGGAQDIGQFRDLVEQGVVPKAETFDANGFFAEHFVEQPATSCTDPLCISAMLARGRDWVTGQPHTALQVALVSTLDPATLPDRPLDLVLVVDRSGSMIEDGRLVKVQSGLRLLLQSLGPEDRLGLVSFESSGRVEARLGSSRQQLGAAIDQLTATGGTNIFDGLALGMQMAASGSGGAERERRVILLSDGMATVGETRSSAILEMAERFVAEGVGLSTIGVGRSFNPVLMRSLAERGAGNFYFVEDAQAVQEVFTDELKVSMTPIALDLEIAVATDATTRIRAVTGRPGWIGTERAGSLRLPAAFAVSRVGTEPDHGRRGGGGVLFFELDELGAPLEQLATVTISYRLPGAAERLSHQVSVGSLALPEGERPVPTVSHQAMQKQAAMFELYRGTIASLRYASFYDGCAGFTLQKTLASARTWNAEFQDDDITADILLLEQLQSTLTKQGLTTPTQAEACSGLPSLPDPGLEPVDDYYPVYRGMACSAGGGASAGALAPLALALGFVVRRRRRG